MRQRLLGSAAALLVGAGAALAESPARLPEPPSAYPIVSGPIAGGPLAAPLSAPVLLPVTPGQPGASLPATGAVIGDPVLTGGSTGLRPGVDFLPDPCKVCKTYPKFYGDLSYMQAWIKNGANPQPLITAAPQPGFGVIGEPGTAALFGGGDIRFGTFDGVQGTLGYWFDCKARFGVESSAFVLERLSQITQAAGGDPAGTLVIARPFIDNTLPPPGEDVFVVAEPLVQVGGVTGTASSRLWGTDTNLVCNWHERSQYRADILAGVRYLDLRETLGVYEDSFLVGTPFRASAVDEIDCRTQFYGGQLGLRTQICRGRISLNMVGKLALGVSHEVVDRRGATTFFGGGAPVTVLGGQLVLPSNYGRDTQDRFAFVPASSVQLAYQLSKYASAFVGYDFLYISSVVRPGENVDRVIDPAGLPLPTGPGAVALRPAGGTAAGDFFMNAVTLGVSFKY